MPDAGELCVLRCAQDGDTALHAAVRTGFTYTFWVLWAVYGANKDIPAAVRRRQRASAAHEWMRGVVLR